MTEALSVEQLDHEPEWTVRCHRQPGGYVAQATRQGSWQVEAQAETEARARVLIGGMMQLVDLDTRARLAS